MDRALQNLVLDVVFMYKTPLTFTSLFTLVNKRKKVRRAKLKECLKDLHAQNKLEIFEDLYKYMNTSREYDSQQINPTDFCCMSINHRWTYYWDRVA